MGVRLDGPQLVLDGALSIPSEPILRGAVQVSGDGIPTVLLADHGTTGGYPKMATVVSADLDRFTQKRAGDAVQFRAITAGDAIIAARKAGVAWRTYLADVSQPRGTLAQRLMRENLVGGVTTGDE
jgi:allophanate hydrolase